MADVVRQRQRFGQIFIHAQNARHRARDLRDLNGMRQPVAKVIRNAGRENLRFVFEAPERPRVNHAVAVALKRIAIRMRQFGIASSARTFQRKPQMGQRAGQITSREPARSRPAGWPNP